MPLAPDVLNYLIGKGEVYFDRFDTNGNSTGERHLGNAPSFAATPTEEDLDHYSSMQGVKFKDLSAIISTDLTYKFSLDEPNIDNLLEALKGAEVVYTSQGDGNINNEVMVARVNRWVKLNRMKITAGTVVVTNAAGTVTYQLNTDYRVDYTVGRIFTISGGNIANGQSLRIDYTHEEAAYPTVYPSTQLKIEGLLRFVGNPDYGNQYMWTAWKVKLTITGDIPMVSEEWAQIEFEAEVLDDSENHPSSPYGEVLELSGDTAVES